MALIARSEDAEDIAAAFLKFKEPVPSSATEITALISELFAISSALLELDTALKDRPYHRLRREVEDDQYIVLKSLDYTFKDVRREFGGLSKPFYRTNREAFNGVWKSIERFFHAESRNTLVARLEYYRLFLQDLCAVVQKLVHTNLTLTSSNLVAVTHQAEIWTTHAIVSKSFSGPKRERLSRKD
jgi:hypothetical protein